MKARRWCITLRRAQWRRRGTLPGRGARWRRCWRNRRSRLRRANTGGCCSRLRMKRRDRLAVVDARRRGPKLVDQPAKVDVAFHGPTAAETFQRVQQAMQDKKEEKEIAGGGSGAGCDLRSVRRRRGGRRRVAGSCDGSSAGCAMRDAPRQRCAWPSMRWRYFLRPPITEER